MLSAEEQQLVSNQDWILAKRAITEKVLELLGYLSEDQKIIVEKEKKWLPQAVKASSPKIAKGENYLQLPYVILDYPRCFDAANIFAVRTMFWWGNFFSMALHISGTYKEMFQQKVIENLSTAKPDFFICINESQWQHHFNTDNYIPVTQLTGKSLTEIITEKPFMKLAVKFHLSQWNEMPVLLNKAFEIIIKLLKT